MNEKQRHLSPRKNHHTSIHYCPAHHLCLSIAGLNIQQQDKSKYIVSI